MFGIGRYRGVEWTSLTSILSFGHQPLTNSQGLVRNELVYTDILTGRSLTLRPNKTDETSIDMVRISYLKWVLYFQTSTNTGSNNNDNGKILSFSNVHNSVLSNYTTQDSFTQLYCEQLWQTWESRVCGKEVKIGVPHRQYFIVVFRDDPFELWDARKLVPLRTMPRRFPRVTALEWSPTSHVKPRRDSETPTQDTPAGKEGDSSAVTSPQADVSMSESLLSLADVGKYHKLCCSSRGKRVRRDS